MSNSFTNNFLWNIAEILKKKECINLNVILPNRRSCRQLKKHLLESGTLFLPKLMAISDFFFFEDFTLPLARFLKDEKPTIPFNTLYSLAEGLQFLIKELTLNKIGPEQLDATVSEDFRPYWEHSFALIRAAMGLPEINMIRARWDILLEKTENIVAIGVDGENLYTKLLLQKAETDGIVITYPVGGEFSDNMVEFLEFDSIFQEGFAVAVAVRRAVFEEKSVLVVSPDQNLTEIIKSELRRWNISADDSGGMLFSKTADGILIASILDMMERRYDTVSVLYALKMSPKFSDIAEKLEFAFRRRGPTPPIFKDALELCPEANLQSLLEGKISDLPETVGSFSMWFDLCCRWTGDLNPKSLDKLRDVAGINPTSSRLTI
jgi:hypothetical protein